MTRSAKCSRPTDASDVPDGGIAGSRSLTDLIDALGRDAFTRRLKLQPKARRTTLRSDEERSD